MTDQQLTVGQAGEDAVLAAVREVIDPFNAQRPGLALGPGDDAAALTLGSGQAVITTDTMSEGQDFRRQWWLDPESLGAAEFEPAEEWPQDVGTKAAAQNLSDINAMGAVPTALVVSLTLPPQTTVAWVANFYRGVLRACEAPGAGRCVVAGGDFGAGEAISVTITALGEPAAGGQLLRRDRAEPGDVLAVCGQLGRAAAGLALLERPGEASVSSDELRHWQDHAAIIRECLQAQQQPQPPLNAGPAALAAGASAGLDLSDGLLRDAGRLAAASRVQIRCDDAALAAEAQPLKPVAGILGLGPAAGSEWVLSGGEDYSLLATFPADAPLPDGFRALGTVEPVPADGQPGVLVAAEPSGTGWDSLRQIL
ncbi:thiamine-phosphate kinase [Nesterenkonia alkaliphila]|uniref:Thiamine-monophosphate kinase n=1 Tax=Nesterenkonia alkaliphila TaxID=1463631 RepID=A0A7K1UH82_9MICC|nr:thiamine-phosphate kinase [Nesterenkonia alkaliphila]MVT25772.1 thiamine-phosphate kinase [Nesterenkonia alkaliphila]GFZ93165.1 thiamine-monophosphate kinase [Nesterenkonia alkaliphila]